MAFPKAKQIKHSHASVTKTHLFSGKEVFSCGIVQHRYLWHPFGALSLPCHLPQVPPLLDCPHSEGIQGQQTLERWEPPVSSLWALLPHSSLTTEQNSQKPDIFPEDGIIFLLVLQLIHGPSEALQTWCCPARLWLSLWFSCSIFVAEHKDSTAKTYPACICWTFGLPIYFFDESIGVNFQHLNKVGNYLGEQW